jgi:hypothetical protein
VKFPQDENGGSRLFVELYEITANFRILRRQQQKQQQQLTSKALNRNSTIKYDRSVSVAYGETLRFAHE